LVLIPSHVASNRVRQSSISKIFFGPIADPVAPVQLVEPSLFFLKKEPKTLALRGLQSLFPLQKSQKVLALEMSATWKSQSYYVWFFFKK
jgi:hypothetical protein